MVGSDKKKTFWLLLEKKNLLQTDFGIKIKQDNLVKKATRRVHRTIIDIHAHKNTRELRRTHPIDLHFIEMF